jgi:hypothetical protein
MSIISHWIIQGRVTLAGVINAIFVGVTFVIAFPYFVRKVVERRLTRIKVEMESGEVSMREGPANYFKGKIATGGKLVITSRRLIFQTGSKRVTAVPLDLVKTASAKKSLGIFPKLFELEINDNTILKFVVDSPEDWVRLAKPN